MQLVIHQTIHGYRDGHRLLSSSLTLNADSARAMLVLSDMSGPAMQPGFEEYVTGYPLPGSEFFVFAKTWYAPEMQRPGCVWTHSLLLAREQVARVAAVNLGSKFQRPDQERAGNAATTPISLDEDASTAQVNLIGLPAAAALVSAVLGQARPVIVAVEKADQLELTFLRLWEELWPAARARFSFCTGSLMPRTVGGALLDLQAVPRALPSSKFRKSAGAAFVVDLRSPTPPEAWVESFLDDANRGATTFRSWLADTAGAGASREVASHLVRIFDAWQESGGSVLGWILGAEGLDLTVQTRLVGMAFDRAAAGAGAAGRRELLQEFVIRQDFELPLAAKVLEEQVTRLFEASRAEGVALVLALLSSKLSGAGEWLLHAAVRLLTPSDLESFGDALAPYLPIIIKTNYQLAFSPVFWSRSGSQIAEMLARFESLNLKHEERDLIIDGILSSEREVAVEALIRFGADEAVFRGLSAITSGQIPLSGQWRSTLSKQPNIVLEWLERLPSPSVRDLEIASHLLSPKSRPARLVAIWKAGTTNTGAITARVAAFGLSLGFWEQNVKSPLFATCFQPTFDAASSSQLPYDEWDWVREYAPASGWTDWDKCGRMANAVARLLKKQNATLSTAFAIVRSRPAIKMVAAFLGNDKDARYYLESLRQMAGISATGSSEQRAALLEHW